MVPCQRSTTIERFALEKLFDRTLTFLFNRLVVVHAFEPYWPSYEQGRNARICQYFIFFRQSVESTFRHFGHLDVERVKRFEDDVTVIVKVVQMTNLLKGPQFLYARAHRKIWRVD